MIYEPFPPNCCRHCGQYKPYTRKYFTTSKGYLCRTCRDCERIMQRHRRTRYEEKHPGKNRENARNWTRNNPERNKERCRKWYYDNPDKVKGRRYDKQNPEKFKAGQRRYSQRHPEKRREILLRRRARKRSLPDIWTNKDWQRCLDYWQLCCAYCGNSAGLFREMKLCSDHVIPLTHPDCPGTVPTNIVPACTSCNSSKNNREISGWLIGKVGARKAKKILAKIRNYFEWIEKEGK